MNIKTKLISTPKARVLVIGNLPKYAFDIQICKLPPNEGVRYMLYDGESNTPYKELINVPLGNWQHLGPLTDIPEDVAEKIVGRYFNNYKPQQKLNQQPQYDMYWVKYSDGTNKHFNTKDECYSHALKMELFHLVAANVKLVNKYGEKPKELNDFDQGIQPPEAYQYDLEKWQAEEAAVFHNPILFLEFK